MQVRILGPLEAFRGDRPLPLGAPKQRTVLAMLLARANDTVDLTELIDELWDEHPPASATANAQMYTANLRRLLTAEPPVARLVKRGQSYELSVDPAGFDLPCFRDLAREGRDRARRGDLPAAIERFSAAAALWRGPAAADVAAGRWLSAWRVALDQERATLLDECIEALLALGSHEAAARQAHDLLLREPLRERTHALLVRAVYLAGDVPAALAAYDAARRTLVAELGLEPGDELRQLHRAILNRAELPPLPGSAAVAVVADRPSVRDRPPAVVPRQLPTDIAGFTGRETYLRRLDAMRSDAGPPGAGAPAAVPIAVIAGTAGVGKTALAVHWAHRVAERFPDGQLYANLRGFGPAGATTEPAAALRGFLIALEVPVQRIPSDLDALAALYRSVLAGRRVLVVLDNARDAEQVRPLIPGSAGCLALVTSRNRLAGLVAAEGARPLELDVLTPAEARDLLAHRIGPRRIHAEPDATSGIVTYCAGLPLALTLMAARAAQRPDSALHALVEEVRQLRGLPDPLDSDDATTDLRAVFSWSYRSVSPPAATLFRQLGLHPGPDITAAAAASLAGLDAGPTRALLTELARAHLVDEPVPGRYTAHDLLRAYAAELAASEDPATERSATLRRVLDHYQHTAYAAALLLHPHRDRIEPGTPAPGTTPERLADRDHAQAWLDAEYPVLLAAVDRAATAGRYPTAWLLTWALADHVQRRGHWQDWVRIQQTALHAARSLDDRAKQAHAHRGLGRAYARLGRLTDADDHYRRALRIFDGLGDLRGQGHVRRGLAWLQELQGDHAGALRQNEAALALFSAAGYRTAEADCRNAIGWNLAHLGEYRAALAYCEQARDLVDDLDDQHVLISVLDSIGFIRTHLDDQAGAVAVYREALDGAQRLGDRYLEGRVSANLAEAMERAGDPAGALALLREAVAILDELGHPEADQVRDELDRLTAGRSTRVVTG
ncbi:SARP family transcriptional regulator [Virgisporangium ochraceum]|uniref:SARP family transcriptional regulator n=1 Tax=Virgisporangium ochraceum TaxID=65505 RepID=A0A8J3ZVQ8_9ACTN|nr:SARP family transcriptional regulator [Virgisporangium ochraceum]